ncbi:MAG: hypothetical protein HN692_01305, partial [Candidatus Cloacimonetes bacterium]|nr:hypothetical protein [Candidatus Cloacimonadota bacterium]
MLKFKPKIIIGFPFDITMIAKFATEKNISIHSPKTIITYGETLSLKRRLLLEKYYQTKIYNFFSMHECSAMISECENGNLHIIEDFGYTEILDKNDNYSDNGTLIGTSFYNYSMPLIRYKIGDQVEMEKSKCNCKRNFRIVKEIVGKQCDYIETPAGKILGAVMSHSIDNAKGVIVSQCIQDSKNHLVIKLVIDKFYNEISEKKLEADLRKRIGNKMKIDFEMVTQL